jgi:hypothetical protein
MVLPHLATDYVAFVDNDVHPEPGWLDTLVACADDTGAWAVAPMYAMPPMDELVVHSAGGVNHIEEHDGRRVLVDRPNHANELVADVRPQLRRHRVEYVEFHCLLVRHEALRRLGAFDEGLLSIYDHNDFGIAVHEAGGEIWSEPATMVVIVPVALRRDLSQMLMRWSRSWNRSSGRRFSEKHGLAARVPHRGIHRYAEHRRYRRFCDATGLPAPFAVLADPIAALAVRRRRRAERRGGVSPAPLEVPIRAAR